MLIDYVLSRMLPIIDFIYQKRIECIPVRNSLNEANLYFHDNERVTRDGWDWGAKAPLFVVVDIELLELLGEDRFS